MATDLRSAFDMNRLQESTSEPSQLRLVENVEDPRVVDAGICSGKVRETVFIGNCLETEHRFLGIPCTKAESAFRRGVVFFRLRPKKVQYFRFSFCNSSSREARNDSDQPEKSMHSKEQWSKTTAHQGAKISVSVGT